MTVSITVSTLGWIIFEEIWIIAIVVITTAISISV
jgi:hypothetical protein